MEMSASWSRPGTSAASRPTSSYSIGRADFSSALGASMPRPSYTASTGAEVLSFEGSSVMAPSTTSSSAAGGVPGDRHGLSTAAASPSPSPRGGGAAADDDVVPKKENVMPGSRQQDSVQQAWWAEVEGLLAQLVPEATLEVLLPLCDALWERLRAPSGPEGPPGVQPASEGEASRRRKRILGAVAGLMDRREPQLLLRLCRVVLGGAPDKGALLGACKLLFKLSKSESNDRRFRDLGLLPLLLGVLSAGSQGGGGGSSGAPATADAVGLEALLYAAGALKNTSADSANQKQLVALGAVATFSSALRAQTQRLIKQPAGEAPATPRGGSSADAAGAKGGVKPAHVLVQLTATLRNVAVSGSSRKQFVSSGCVEELCGLLAAAPAHAELCLNVSRVLAKLSLHEDVRSRIDARPQHMDALVQALKLHTNERQLLIRLCFILGNVSAAHAANREKIAKLGLPLLLDLLEQYTSETHLAALAASGAGAGSRQGVAVAPAAALGTFRPPPKMATCSTSTAEDEPPAAPAPAAAGVVGTDAASSIHDATAASAPASAAPAPAAPAPAAASRGEGNCEAAATEDAERVDVLVKLIRLIAHLAISPAIGEQIATSPSSLALLKVLQVGRMEVHEELLLNAASAVTNLTYYMPDSSALLRSHAQLCQVLVPVLVFPNAEGMIEAARALGNLSRLAEARVTLCAARVHEALLLLLDHTSSQVAEAACGALINLAADPATRELLTACHAAPRLADLLLTLLSPPVGRGAAEGGAADGGAGGGARATAPPPPQRSDVGAALLATKTIVNLCCACEVCPLDAALVVAVEERLRESSGEGAGHESGDGGGGGEVVRSWRSLPEAAEMLVEWPQATRLLLGLLQRLPASDIAPFSLEDEDEYEESPLEEIPALD